MAQFDARINLILNAQKALKEAEKVAKTLEQKFSRLEKTVAKQGPLDKYIQQNDELVKQKKLQQDLINSNKAQIQQEKASLNYQLRLTAALQRQATVKQALERAGGPSNIPARERVEGAINAAAVDRNDLSLQQAVNTLLEKELQIRRELNRTEAAQAAIAGKNKVGAEYDQRVAALRRAGVEESKLLQIEKARLELSALNSKKQTDLARAQNAEVERLIKAEEKLLQTQKASAAVAQQRRREVGQRVGNALASGAIGGAFPLLFGQSGPGAIGGAAGGIAGGLIGGQFGFALSLVGSALGDAVQKSDDLNKSIAGLNASFDTASVSVSLTRDEIADLAKDLSLANDEAVTLLGSFSAFTSPQAAELARGFGDIGGVSTAEAVAKARLGEKEALEAINSLRSVIGNKEADSLLKTLEIKGAQAASAALLDALLQKQKDITTETQNTVTFWDQIQSRVASITAALSGVGDPAAVPSAQDIADERTAALPEADKGIIDTALVNLERFYKKSAELQEKYGTKRGGRSGTNEEQRIQQRLASLQAETAAVQRRAEIESKISQARIAEDQSLVNRLTLERELSTIREREEKAAARVTDARLKQAIAEKASAEAAAARSRYTDKEAERIAAAEQSYTQQIEVLNLQLEAAQAITREEKEQADLQLKLLRLRNANKDLSAEQLQNLEEATRKLAAATNLGPLESYIKNTSAALADTEMQMTKIVQTIEGQLASGITNFFTGIIDGSKSAEEAFADMLKGMGQALIQQAAIMIAQYIAIGIARAFAGMGTPSKGSTGVPGLEANSYYGTGGRYGSFVPPGRANGGPVNENAPYIVGENGPELFVPGKSGTVVNNDDFADAAAAMSSGSPQAFADNEEALIAATAAFNQSHQAMTEATATRSANTAAAAEASALQTAEQYFATGKSTVTFDTYRVGEMDVVTREDAIRIGQQSAKQAEANVYKGLRNMPAVRGRSGVK